MRPRALDLFSRAGGVSEGLLLAGFDVVAVDILDCSKAFNRGPGNPERHERPAVFVQADALTFPLDGFDFIWASPPCQAYSIATRNIGTATGRPDLLPATRERLKAHGAPWCLENVPGAPMRSDLVLCGCMFGLPLRRARWFEMEPRLFDLLPTHNHSETPIGVYGNGTPSWHREKLGRNTTVEDWRLAMGIDWMGRDDLSQAIPPAYARWIGERALEEIEARRQREQVA